MLVQLIGPADGQWPSGGDQYKPIVDSYRSGQILVSMPVLVKPLGKTIKTVW